MPGMSVALDGDHAAFGERVGIGRVPIVHTLEDWSIDPLEGGMASGKTSLMVAIPVYIEGEGSALVLAETSLQAWMLATSVLRSKFSEEVDVPGWAILSDETKALLIPRYAEAIRRVIPDITAVGSLELAELFLDGLAAGAPMEDG